MSVNVKTDSIIVEDTAWLRKKTDYDYINVAELDATIKGVNLALKWSLKDMEIRRDLTTVLSWIGSVITEKKKVQTKGAVEMVIR